MSWVVLYPRRLQEDLHERVERSSGSDPRCLLSVWVRGNRTRRGVVGAHHQEAVSTSSWWYPERVALLLYAYVYTPIIPRLHLRARQNEKRHKAQIGQIRVDKKHGATTVLYYFCILFDGEATNFTPN